MLNYIGGPYIARATAACSVNTNDTITNDAIDIVAIRVGHDWNISNFPKHIRDAARIVRGLSPAGDSGHSAHGWDVSGSRKAGRCDVVAHGKWTGQFNEGQIIGEVLCVPLWMGPSVVGGHLHPMWFAARPHVVRSCHHVKVACVVGTVGCSQNVVL